MKRSKLLKRVVVFALAMVMLLGIIPVAPIEVSAAATTAAKYQNDMWNSAILRAWEYMGSRYVLNASGKLVATGETPVQALRRQNLLFASPDKFPTGDGYDNYHSGILYPEKSDEDYKTADGTEVITNNSTYTGKAPDLQEFRDDGMVCAGFTTYYVLNYMKNIEGLECPDFEEAMAKYCSPQYGNTYYRVLTWFWCLEDLVGSGEGNEIAKKSSAVTKIYTGDKNNPAPIPDAYLAKMQPGDIIVFGRKSDSGSFLYKHIGIYAGSYNGKHFIIHCGGPRGEYGPNMDPLRETFDGEDDKTKSHPIGVYRLNYTPLKETSITVNKKDEENKPLAGAVFTATHTNGTVHTFPATGANGTAKLENIPFGTYTIRETKAPDGYVLSDETWTVTVGGSVNNSTTVYHRSITATNEPESADLKIIKTTDTNMDLAGWQFEVRDSENNLVGTYTTTADDTKKQGVVLAEGLEPGVYTVKEIIPTDSDYETTEVSKTVTVRAGAENSVTFHNTIKRGSIKVEKTDPGDEPLAGAVFTATHNEFGTQYTFPETDEQGFAKLENLPYGTYTVKETKAPVGHILPDTTWTATVGEGEGESIDYVLPVTNDPIKQTLEIIKTTDTGENLAGWVFEVYRKPDNTLVGTYTTTADDAKKQGIVLVADLEPGEYIVKEIIPADSDYETTEASKTVTVEFGGENSVTFHNTIKRCSIVVQKVTNTGNDLEGWEIELYRDSVAPENHLETKTTNAEGKVEFTGLMPGKYIIHEKTEKEFWFNKTGDITVELQPGGSITKNLENELRGNLEIVKVILDGDASVEGWQFKVTNVTDEENPVEIGTYTTDQDGVILREDLEEGTYLVEEIIPQDSIYECLGDNPKTVEVKAGQVNSVTFENAVKRGSIEVRKLINTENEEDKYGWTIKLYRDSVSEESWIATKTTSAENGGVVVFDDLLPGTYVVHESTEKDFWINETGDVTVELKPTVKETEEVALENKIYGDLKIVKVVLDGDASVAGWEFEITNITDPENPVKLPGSYVTVEGEDEDGNKVGIICVEDLEEGTYLVEEILSEDSDYIYNGENPRKIEVKAGRVNEVVFENELQKGTAKIIKVTNTGKNLEGWKFNVYTDKEKTTLVEGSPFTTNAQGIITVELIPGTYYVQEVDESETKPNWRFDTELKEITIVEFETEEVRFENIQLGSFKVLKTDPAGNPLEGAIFLVEWSEDGKTWTPVTYCTVENAMKGGCSSPDLKDGKLVTGEDGIAHFTGLWPELQYRVTEAQAPAGYLMQKKIVFEDKLTFDNLDEYLPVVNKKIIIKEPDSPNTGDINMPALIGLSALSLVCILGLAILPGKKRTR